MNLNSEKKLMGKVQSDSLLKMANSLFDHNQRFLEKKRDQCTEIIDRAVERILGLLPAEAKNMRLSEVLSEEHIDIKTFYREAFSDLMQEVERDISPNSKSNQRIMGNSKSRTPRTNKFEVEKEEKSNSRIKSKTPNRNYNKSKSPKLQTRSNSPLNRHKLSPFNR